MTSPAPSPQSDPVYDYPVVLCLAGRKCLVVGGGPVAARRVEGLMAAGARVTVVAPSVVDALDALAGERASLEPAPYRSGTCGSLEIEHRPYQDGEAAHYDLVITATGRTEVDRVVVGDASAAGVPVNSADRATPGTIQIPAVHRAGPVVVAVSTGGTSPALAQWLRDRIVSSIPPEVATISSLLEEARASMRDAGRSTGSVNWVAVLDGEVAPLVAAGRVTEARAALVAACAPPPPE